MAQTCAARPAARVSPRDQESEGAWRGAFNSMYFNAVRRGRKLSNDIEQPRVYAISRVPVSDDWQLPFLPSIAFARAIPDDVLHESGPASTLRSQKCVVGTLRGNEISRKDQRFAFRGRSVCADIACFASTRLRLSSEAPSASRAYIRGVIMSLSKKRNSVFYVTIRDVKNVRLRYYHNESDERGEEII